MTIVEGGTPLADTSAGYGLIAQATDVYAGVADGDWLYVLLTSDNGLPAGEDPGGWTKVHELEFAGSPSLGVELWCKIASSESGTYDFNPDLGNGTSHFRIFTDDVGGGDFTFPAGVPHDESTAEVDSATGTTAAVDVGNGDLLVCGFSTDEAPTIDTAPPSMTGALESISGTRSQSTYYELVSPAEGTATRTIIYTASQQIVMSAIVLEYVSAGGVTPEIVPPLPQRIVRHDGRYH